MLGAAHPYSRGLHEIGADVWAWLEPDGGYGRSNAGLVRGRGSSWLVDALFDLPMTERMLAAMAEVTVGAPLRDAVLTHADGDHTHGTQLLGPEVRILAAAGTRRSGSAASGCACRTRPSTERSPWTSADARWGSRTSGPPTPPPTRSCTSPTPGWLFAGDLLFIGGTPVVWAGPTGNWIAACDTMVALGAPTVVPGHGPVTDPDGIRASPTT
ncbi:MAG TPA: MBL fold metallo-hydrolase [Thermomonospora sp.]|nr:MBL fold metallo-hydrolase [Thermomonospora sp.]